MPSLPVFIDICKALKISPDYLMQDILPDNEVSEIKILTELWKSASPSKQAVATTMLKSLFESDAL